MVDNSTEEISVRSIFRSFGKGNPALSIKRRGLFSSRGAVFIYGKNKNKTRRKKTISSFLVGILSSLSRQKKKKWSMHSCSWTFFPRTRATPHNLKEATVFHASSKEHILFNVDEIRLANVYESSWWHVLEKDVSSTLILEERVRLLDRLVIR